MANRARRGEGGVYQRESDGLWVGLVSLRYDGTGKRRRTVYGATKREVLEKLAALGPDARGGVAAKPATLTVARFLTSWLESIRSSIELTSWDAYEQHVRIHISPRIGSVRLSALTALHVQDMIAGMLKNGTTPAMARRAGVTLRTAIKAAVEQHLIPLNVALAAKLPKVQRYVPKVFTPDQVAAFAAAAAADRYEGFYPLAIDSGCRLGELFALT